MKLQFKIVAYLCGGLLAVGLLTAFLVGYVVKDQIGEKSKSTLAAQLEQLVVMLDSYRLQTERLAIDHNAAFANTAQGEWQLATAEQIATDGKKFPALKLAGRAVNNDFSLPDQHTRIHGSFATILIRSGEDFYRLATSLKKGDGSRATGTALGSAHPAVARLLTRPICLIAIS